MSAIIYFKLNLDNLIDCSDCVSEVQQNYYVTNLNILFRCEMSPNSTAISKTEHLSENRQEGIVTDLANEDIVPQYEKYKFLIWEFETPLLWPKIIIITIFHILTIVILLTHSYISDLGIALYGFLVGCIGGFGITAGAHRYFSHRSYKAKLPLRIILLFCYTVAGQNSVKQWVRDHRVHHKYSETMADPHNAKRGFFFSHVGWLMMKKHPEVIKKGKQLDLSDLFEDPLLVFHEKYFPWLRLLLCFILPTIIPPLTWGESWFNSIKVIVIARYTINLNLTWIINSVAHIWGTKPYDKRIGAVDATSIAVFTMGESYHNYHHTFPWDYRAAEVGKYLNLTTFWLNTFSKIGWVYDMKSPSLELVEKVARNHGDGTHYKWGHEVSCEEAEIFKKTL